MFCSESGSDEQLDRRRRSEGAYTVPGKQLESSLSETGLQSNSANCATIFSVLTQSNCTLTWLELCGNPIYDEQEGRYVAENREALFRLVTESRGLKYIGLGMTCLGDEECYVLQKALSATSGSITFLSLGRNRNHVPGSGGSR